MQCFDIRTHTNGAHLETWSDRYNNSLPTGQFMDCGLSTAGK
jgi:hypothetical protein